MNKDKKIIFIADIHSNLEALKVVLEDIYSKWTNIVGIYCLGDIVGYGPNPNETIDLLREHGIKSILGNYDEAVGFYLLGCGCHINSEKEKIMTQNSLKYTSSVTSEYNKAWLRELEESIIIQLEDKEILLTHGSPLSINDYVYKDNIDKQAEIANMIDEDIIVFGHTHYPYYKYINDKLFINVGSVGRPKDGNPKACYCVLHMNDSLDIEFVRVEYDVRKVAKQIRECELLNEFAQILINGSTNI